ncbi:MAG: hypothetical protein ABR530_03695 [Pyrinomonadaceae bacterium]
MQKNKSLYCCLVIAAISLAIGLTKTQATASNRVAPQPIPTPAALFSAYKGIAIGAAADDARAKLGAPKEKSADRDYYVFSESESSQLYYDPAGKVRAMMITYSKMDAAPTAKSVFGEDAEVKPDGGIFKMVKYPKAGYWISYTKTGGEDPMVIIAMQKM